MPASTAPCILTACFSILTSSADWEAGLTQLQPKREAIVPKPKDRSTKPGQPPLKQVQQTVEDAHDSPLDRDDGAEPPVAVPFGGAHILECTELSKREAINDLEDWCQAQQYTGLPAVVR